MMRTTHEYRGKDHCDGCRFLSDLADYLGDLNAFFAGMLGTGAEDDLRGRAVSLRAELMR